jgi:radical SAM superfamily enzyme YgiQ (UPF0313 family)
MNPIVTEPLELEYLAAALGQAGIASRIFDPWLEDEPWQKVLVDYRPEVLALSCYITGVPATLKLAEAAKKILPTVRVIVGGVHAAINPADFFNPAVDIVVHSGGGATLSQLLVGAEHPGEHGDGSSVRLDSSRTEEPSPCSGSPAPAVAGIAYQLQGQWVLQPGQPQDPDSFPQADRAYGRAYQRKTRYLEYSPMALLQTALSCPHQCNYCYCRLLNHGEYRPRDIAQVVEEMAALEAEYVWLVDDTFLLERARVQAFIDLLRRQRLPKKIIAYSRTDFICQNADLMASLAEVGLVELIVGMESIAADQMEAWGKSGGSQVNQAVIEILAAAGIRLTALFMVHPDYSREDFRRLAAWLHHYRPATYTVAIFTPLPGTQAYEEYQARITDFDLRRRDFLHLVIAPSQMTRLEFYARFCWLHSFGLEGWRRFWARRPRKKVRGKPALLRNPWNFWAKRYERLWVQRYSLRPTRRQILSYLAAILDQERVWRILDVGCGTGQTLREIREAFPTYRLELTGVDSSPAMICQAQKATPKEISLQVMDVEQLDALAHNYDVVICTHSFPYYPRQARALQRIGQRLQPGGHLLIGHASVVSEYDRWAMRLIKLTTGPAHYLSPKELMALGEGLVEIQQVVPIKEMFLMPSIYTFHFKKVAPQETTLSAGEELGEGVQA